MNDLGGYSVIWVARDTANPLKVILMFRAYSTVWHACWITAVAILFTGLRLSAGWFELNQPFPLINYVPAAEREFLAVAVFAWIMAVGMWYGAWKERRKIRLEPWKRVVQNDDGTLNVIEYEWSLSKGLHMVIRPFDSKRDSSE